MQSFRKYIALSWLFLFLFSNAELHELFKLPGLWIHYQEHLKESKESLTFQVFLKMHYNEETTPQDVAHHHEKLPFKDESGCAHGFTVALLHHEEEEHFYLANPNQPRHAKIPAYFSLSASKGIWQPPRCI